MVPVATVSFVPDWPHSKGALEDEQPELDAPPFFAVVRPFPTVALPARGETVLAPREFSTITTRPDPVSL